MLYKSTRFCIVDTCIMIGLAVLPVPAAAVTKSAKALTIQAQVQLLTKTGLQGHCDLPPGWNGVAQRHTKFVVFGEVHGTQEVPAFVGNLACALSEHGERVLVAIEHSAKYDAAFQAAWIGPHETFEASLRSNAGWTDAMME